MTREPRRCPFCETDVDADHLGGMTRERATKKLTGDGRTETWDRWERYRCGECDEEFALLDKRVRFEVDGDGEEIGGTRTLVADGGRLQPEYGQEWQTRAERNILEWGVQHPETLLLAIQEELGELCQAYLEATYEDGDRARVVDEVDDLGPLLIQLIEALDEHPGAYEPVMAVREADS